jgi:hypothetical protein
MQTPHHVPLAIPSEYMICVDVPSTTFLQHIPDTWSFVEHENNVLEAELGSVSTPIIDVLKVKEAVSKNSTVILSNPTGSLLYKYMFPVPHHQAFACFIDNNGYPVAPIVKTMLALPKQQDNESSSLNIGHVVYVALDPLDSDKVIAPPHPDDTSSEEKKPMFETLSELSAWTDDESPCKVMKIDPLQDLSRSLLVFKVGQDNNLVVLFQGQFLPRDNSHRVFFQQADGQLMYPPADAQHMTQQTYTGLDSALSELISYYMSSSRENIRTTSDTAGPLLVSDKVVEQLSTMIQNHSSVRKSIIEQLDRKVGRHIFQNAETHDMFHVFNSIKPSDNVYLTVNMDHSFLVSFNSDETHTSVERNVTLKQITILFHLV